MGTGADGNAVRIYVRSPTECVRSFWFCCSCDNWEDDLNHTIDLLIPRLCTALDVSSKNNLKNMGLALDDENTTKRTLYAAVIAQPNEAVTCSNEWVDFLQRQKMIGFRQNDSIELLDLWGKFLIGKMKPEIAFSFFYVYSPLFDIPEISRVTLRTEKTSEQYLVQNWNSKEGDIAESGHERSTTGNKQKEHGQTLKVPFL